MGKLGTAILLGCILAITGATVYQLVNQVITDKDMKTTRDAIMSKLDRKVDDLGTGIPDTPAELIGD